jgi:RNA polymerase sigma-70 factor, ECF subfamily
MPTIADPTQSNDPGSSFSDGSLIQMCRSGNAMAARKLYLRYAERLRALAAAQCAPELQARFDADDIVQSVFCEFFTGLKECSYDAPEGQQLWGLLFVIALHKIRNQAKRHRAAKRNVGQTRGSDSLENLEAVRTDEASCEFLMMLIEDEIRDCSPVNQKIIRMRIESYGIDEIVEETGRSRRTVERVLQEFRHKLSASQAGE